MAKEIVNMVDIRNSGYIPVNKQKKIKMGEIFNLEGREAVLARIKTIYNYFDVGKNTGLKGLREYERLIVYQVFGDEIDKGELAGVESEIKKVNETLARFKKNAREYIRMRNFGIKLPAVSEISNNINFLKSKGCIAVPALLNVIISNEVEPNERIFFKCILFDIFKSDPSKAAPILTKMLEEKAQEVRELAVYGLIAIGKPAAEQAQDVLIKLLDEKNEKSLSVRMSATRAVGILGFKKSEEALIKNLRGADYPPLREVSAEALGKIRSKKSEAYLRLRIVKDPNEFVRAICAKALGDLGAVTEETQKILIEQLAKDSSFRVRVSCAASLGNKYNFKKAEPYLIESLKDPIIDVKNEAARVLEENKSLKSVPKLIKACLPDYPVYYFKKALENIGGATEEELPELEEIVKGNYPDYMKDFARSEINKINAKKDAKRH